MIVHDVGALREGRIDCIELSAVVEDFVHIANEVADGLEFVAQYFGLQCGEILTRRKEMRFFPTALPGDCLTHWIFDNLVIVRHVFHIDRFSEWPGHFVSLRRGGR